MRLDSPEFKLHLCLKQALPYSSLPINSSLFLYSFPLPNYFDPPTCPRPRLINKSFLYSMVYGIVGAFRIASRWGNAILSLSPPVDRAWEANILLSGLTRPVFKMAPATYTFPNLKFKFDWLIGQKFP
jgi:hypothetical protein